MFTVIATLFSHLLTELAFASDGETNFRTTISARVGAQVSPRATLEDCYKAAIERSATLSDREQQIIQAQEKESQALGNILPQLSTSATYLVQQAPTDPAFAAIFPSAQPTVKLTVTQALFRGLKEYAGLKQLSHLTRAQEQEKQKALVQLHVDVSKGFYSLVSLEQDLVVLKAQLNLYDERIKDLHRRTRAGLSTASDALTARAAKASTQAQLKKTEGEYRANLELFLFLTGLPREASLLPPRPDPAEKTQLLEYLNALEKRPDIIAEKQKLDASEHGVFMARASHLPTADFTGNYYLVRPPGFFRDIKWDVAATLTIPIFSGGVVNSQVSEALSHKVQSEAVLTNTRRSAESEIRSLYQSYQSGLEEIDALEESMKLAEENYFVLKKDYSKGLARNSDVLQAMSKFHDGKRDLNKARWNTQAVLTRLQLVSSIKSLPTLGN